uniref:Uncharacterized protein n=1 Tax=Amphimedon queenslandica TaxID=400682 RepID=A0A1X7SSU3_AMPQE
IIIIIINKLYNTYYKMVTKRKETKKRCIEGKHSNKTGHLKLHCK